MNNFLDFDALTLNGSDMASLDFQPSFSMQSVYRQTALRLSNELAVASVVIFAHSAAILLLRHFLATKPSSTQLLFRLALALEPALEFPLIFAFHPSTLMFNPQYGARFPLADHILLQVLAFFVIELAFQNCVLKFVTIPTDETARGISFQHGAKPGRADGDEAEKLVMDFLRPRGTLLIAVAVLSTPSGLSRYTGQLHPMAMVAWAVLERCLDFDERGE